jgi:hypothetical protein
MNGRSGPVQGDLIAESLAGLEHKEDKKEVNKIRLGRHKTGAQAMA